MKFTVGSFWRTRDGRKARIICVDARGTEPIVALLSFKSYEDVLLFDSAGTYSISKHDYDLIEPWKDPPPPKPKMQAWMDDSGIPIFTSGKMPSSVSCGQFIRAPWLDEPEGEGTK